MLNSNFELICEKWAPIAQEYAKFLNRYGMETVCIISGKTQIGILIKVFADEEKYISLSLENMQFSLEEKQINKLLSLIETLYIKVFNLDKSENENDLSNEPYYEEDIEEE